MELIWEKVKSALKEQIPSNMFRMWIEPLRLAKVDAEVMQIQCPNIFSRKRVLDHFNELICSEMNRVAGQLMTLDLIVAKNGTAPVDKDLLPQQLPLPNMAPQPHCGRLLRRDYTFDQFVVGKNNEFAYSAALSMAVRKGLQQNALFLLSKTGMGKSHLSQAVGHRIISESPAERVYYMTAEDFTNEMVTSYKSNTVNLFKDKYHNGCDVLLLEDVHYLSGKGRTQIELAHTLDSLYNENKTIIFSSCCSPSEIPKLSDNLRSRLVCGLISNIEPPDYRMRFKILQRFAQVNNWRIPKEVLEFLATELTQDVRQLKSGLVGVSAKASLLGVSIDVPLATDVIKNIVNLSKTVSIGRIKKLVCKYYNVTPKDLVSRSRKQAIVRPRQVAIYLARRYTDQPLQAIGRSFNRYHATALHAIGAVEKGMAQGGAIRRHIEYLSKKLETGDF
ncbi:MAG: chromosomal replication initiator protein DnaA [Desulfatitalea sp.]|nr:chromosomal replication initiator protein DnaA [Desulfatitalea sp.]NNK00962.1 chromosomal replication initiator protein DnaA [Desulfatitalea sp.]